MTSAIGRLFRDWLIRIPTPSGQVIVWLTSRRRTSGSTYEEILAAGGGIRSTIRATAAASQDDLVALAKPRIDSLIASGATTIEIKSGYGFTPEAELAMLEAIQALSAICPARIMPTLLIHIPPAIAAERSSYISRVCEDLIPEAARRNLATAVDIFIEKEAWQVAEAEELFRHAKAAWSRNQAA